MKLSAERERIGMIWWNGLKPAERLAMFRRAKESTGKECSPAETFDLWERGEIK